MVRFTILAITALTIGISDAAQTSCASDEVQHRYPRPEISLDTQQKSSWAWNLSQDIYQEYVATYAHVNEARVDWRPIITTATSAILDNALSTTDLSTVEDVVSYISSQMWHTETTGLVNNVTFKSSQTPLICDPMSTLIYGYASCTGVSILFADALKYVGIAARMCDTPT
ncbi:hypothetical protein TrLO_g7211 [Triparma laevis f. longispina]|uniref:Uncharacterized protein n=1 Tax=Triparma laevis f. longispina TaxID=1714387 RepID=A0A9W7AN24_9STRA|nr:hypothetical protein TrLO_g7211 [Triparma laevis f. longispina]